MTTLRQLLGALLLVSAAHGAELDHSAWNSLAQTYVSAESHVDYRGLKDNGLQELDAYLAQLEKPWPAGMQSQETKAALINAYNALTIRWILSNYPVESIWKTDNPFQEPRHTVNGETLSLDQIETRLREMDDPRIHAALVCAARSCPPLRHEAYVAGRIDEQLDDNTRSWLANRQLNVFDPVARTARISPIFEWYASDFETNRGLREFLARHAPPDARFLREAGTSIEYETYHWGLNDASGLGEKYSHVSSYWDLARGGYLYGTVKNWFLGLGREYGVNPIVFGSIYVGAIPFFSLSIAWLIRNVRRGRSPVVPALCASFCFISAYLYLLVAGKNIPAWVYLFLAAMVAFGVYSTLKKVRARLREGDRA
jgi:hypothetical protein